jgi:hypothetical protein
LSGQIIRQRFPCRTLLEHEFVDVTPHPVFAGFLGADYGMFGGVEVFCGVLVLRGVAAADVAAGQTQAQMHPNVAHFETLFAAFGLWLNALDLIEVRTSIGHAGLL